MILGIYMAISLMFEHSNIVEVFKGLLIPLLVFVPFESELGFAPYILLSPYLVAIPLTWFLIKKDLLSLKRVLIFSVVAKRTKSLIKVFKKIKIILWKS
jgi:hypothetical protein